MLIQKPYHHPYIPSSPASLPYVGGELAQMTSMTPFYRGQGEPIYPYPKVIRKTNFGRMNYGEIMVGLKQGDKGKSVEDLQNALIAKGYYLSGGADGDFGPSTTSAVKQFQADNKLGQTGIVDAETKKELGKEKGAGLQSFLDIAQGLIPTTTTPESGGTTINITQREKSGLGLGAKIGIGLAIGTLVIGTLIYASK